MTVKREAGVPPQSGIASPATMSGEGGAREPVTQEGEHLFVTPCLRTGKKENHARTTPKTRPRRPYRGPTPAHQRVRPRGPPPCAGGTQTTQLTPPDTGFTGPGTCSRRRTGVRTQGCKPLPLEAAKHKCSS